MTEKECCGSCDQDDKIVGKDEKASTPKVHFIILKLESGQMLLGRLSKLSHELWISGATKIVLEGTRELLIQPVVEAAGTDRERVIGFQTAVIPVYPLKTPQERLTLNADKITYIEMLGELEEDESGTFICPGASMYVRTELLKFYNDNLMSWKIELSGIVPPTVADVNAIKGNIRRFSKNKPFGK